MTFHALGLAATLIGSSGGGGGGGGSGSLSTVLFPKLAPCLLSLCFCLSVM
jgi:hypothetical protein